MFDEKESLIAGAKAEGANPIVQELPGSVAHDAGTEDLGPSPLGTAGRGGML